MRFGTSLPGTHRYPPALQPWHVEMAPADYQRVARVAEEAGFYRINIPEHIVMPDGLAEAMGHYWSHAMTAMAFVAGATTTLRVGSSVLVLPYHQPVVLAKAVATLDVLSGGRVDLAIGIGHAEHEFEALGLSFHDRGRRSDEYLRAMKELWTSDRPTFKGEWIAFDGIAFAPRPVQQPHPPIIVGGNSKPALRRAAALGDGWQPWLIEADDLPRWLDELRTLPGFDADRPFDIVLPVANPRVSEADHRPVEGDGRPRLITGRQELLDAIAHLRDIGVTSTSVPEPPTASLEEHLDHLRWVGSEIIPQFA